MKKETSSYKDNMYEKELTLHFWVDCGSRRLNKRIYR